MGIVYSKISKIMNNYPSSPCNGRRSTEPYTDSNYTLESDNDDIPLTIECPESCPVNFDHESCDGGECCETKECCEEEECCETKNEPLQIEDIETEIEIAEQPPVPTNSPSSISSDAINADLNAK